jgi:hypothetical protein
MRRMLGTIGATLAIAIGLATPGSLAEAQQREAPAILKDPTAHNTDVWALTAPDAPPTGLVGVSGQDVSGERKESFSPQRSGEGRDDWGPFPTRMRSAPRALWGAASGLALDTVPGEVWLTEPEGQLTEFPASADEQRNQFVGVGADEFAEGNPLEFPASVPHQMSAPGRPPCGKQPAGCARELPAGPRAGARHVLTRAGSSGNGSRRPAPDRKQAARAGVGVGVERRARCSNARGRRLGRIADGGASRRAIGSCAVPAIVEKRHRGAAPCLAT